MPRTPPTDDVLAGGPTPDPIHDSYQGPTGGAGPLVEEPPEPTSPRAPSDPGRSPGAAKWPRERAYAYLASCPKTPVYVPLSAEEQSVPGRYYQEVMWQGWMVHVLKGRTVYAPQPISALIENMLDPVRTLQMRSARSIDFMLITPGRPGGMLIAERSDPMAIERDARGNVPRFDD